MESRTFIFATLAILLIAGGTQSAQLPILGPILDGIINGLLGTINTLLISLTNALKASLDTLLGALVGTITGTVTEIVEAVLKPLNPILEKVLALVASLVGKSDAVLNGIAPLLGNLLKKLTDGISALVEPLLGKINELVEQLLEAVKNGTGAVQPLIDQIKFWVNVLLGIITGTIKVLAGIDLFGNPIIDAILIPVRTALAKILEQIASLLCKLGGLEVPLVEGLVKPFLELALNVLGQINDIVEELLIENCDVLPVLQTLCGTLGDTIEKVQKLTKCLA